MVMDQPRRAEEILSVDATAMTVDLRLAGGETFRLSLKNLIEEGAIFQPLADPACFQRMHLLHGGRAMGWEEGPDATVEALLRDYGEALKGPATRQAVG